MCYILETMTLSFETYLSWDLVSIDDVESIFGEQVADGAFASCNASGEAYGLELRAEVDAEHLEYVDDELDEEGHAEAVVEQDEVHHVDQHHQPLGGAPVLGLQPVPVHAQEGIPQREQTDVAD